MNAAPSPNSRSLEHQLAPHVERRWTEAFIVELRLQGVSGEDLGAALAEVDSHCAEAGESAQQTFGDPVDYAKSLRLPAGPANSPGATLLKLIPTLIQIIGFMTLIRASPSYIPGDPVAITGGDLGLLGTFAAAVAIFVWQVGPLNDLVVRRPVVATLALAVIIIAMVVPVFLWQEPVAEFSVLGAITFGVVLLVVGTVWEVIRVHAEAAEEEISRPLDSSEELKRRRRFGLGMNYFRIFTFPVIAGLVIGAVMLLS